MKHKVFVIWVFCFVPMILCAQLSLTIEIDGLRNNNGHIHLEFSNEIGEQVAGLTKNITNKKCIIVIEDLKPGRYAFKFFHDENKNEKLDANWLGIPREGFGFSNNPAMTFGPPSFDKTLFLLNDSKVMKCKPKYY